MPYCYSVLPSLYPPSFPLCFSLQCVAPLLFPLLYVLASCMRSVALAEYAMKAVGSLVPAHFHNLEYWEKVEGWKAGREDWRCFLFFIWSYFSLFFFLLFSPLFFSISLVFSSYLYSPLFSCSLGRGWEWKRSGFPLFCQMDDLKSWISLLSLFLSVSVSLHCQWEYTFWIVKYTNSAAIHTHLKRRLF